jgi:hypothetical protein
LIEQGRLFMRNGFKHLSEGLARAPMSRAESVEPRVPPPHDDLDKHRLDVPDNGNFGKRGGPSQ